MVYEDQIFCVLETSILQGAHRVWPFLAANRGFEEISNYGEPFLDLSWLPEIKPFAIGSELQECSCL
jgi:hypothetical protein